MVGASSNSALTVVRINYENLAEIDYIILMIKSFTKNRFEGREQLPIKHLLDPKSIDSGWQDEMIIVKLKCCRLAEVSSVISKA